MSKIPIKALKEMSKAYGLDHIIVFATGGKEMKIASYGRTIDECSEAADFANKLKDAMGWPESLHQQPSRVRKLQARIKELEQFINDAGLPIDEVGKDPTLEHPQNGEQQTDNRPHSRACGFMAHPHGAACSSNCPTCHGEQQ